MDLELKWRDLTWFEVLGRATATHEEALETAIPEYCPDMNRIVDATGQLQIRDREITGGAVMVSGMVSVRVLYSSEESSGLRSLEVSVPFRCTQEGGNLAACRVLRAEGRLLLTEAKAVSARRLYVRVLPEVTVTGYGEMHGRLCCAAEGDASLAVRTRETPLRLLSAVAEKQCPFTQETMLQTGQETPEEVLAARTQRRVHVLGSPVTRLHARQGDYIAAVREVEIEDLLGRAPVQLENPRIGTFLRGKTVLVTGGGGSIGSELCRQIAANRPERLVILDVAENTTYELQNDLLHWYGEDFPLSVEIASVRDRQRLEQIFAKYRPQLVFHAAAHKHVPPMEGCPEEAVENNVFGTFNTADMARRYGAEKFVLISTDKAVNPTNIMGATKNLCEEVLQGLRGVGGTEFAAVRFGNVLGSSGSVIPLFKKQISYGGPVTLTDRRIIRYFMTIPEAAQLVLEAGSFARSGEVFVLNMGEPVRIFDLAEKLIRLSGFVPGADIEIREVGLRPGEKLYEELLMSNEKLKSTENEKIFVEERPAIPEKELRAALEELQAAIDAGNRAELLRLMHALVPTFRAPEEVNREAQERLERKAAI